MNPEVESVTSVASKVAVPAALGGQLVFGYTIPEIAGLMGIAYTGISLFFLLYDRIKLWRKGK